MRIDTFKSSRLLMLLIVMLVSPTLPAAETMVSFDTEAQASLYQQLLREYRCLKCQNQNLADSNASLALDLRREIRDQVMAGNAKSQIDEYLVARYGEFVLYRPRFSSKTLVLWLLPFALFLAAVAGLFISSRRRKQLVDPIEPDGLEPDQLAAAKRYLENP